MEFFDFLEEGEIDSQQTEIWLKDMDNKYLQMREFLFHHVTDKALQDKLKDQLTWLNFQKEYYEKTGKLHNLAEDFNWVVGNFNQDLSLSEEKKFSKIASPQRKEGNS